MCYDEFVDDQMGERTNEPFLVWLYGSQIDQHQKNQAKLIIDLHECYIVVSIHSSICSMKTEAMVSDGICFTFLPVSVHLMIELFLGANVHV